MARLLGSRFCIDSLRVDVADLQQVIAAIASRCGPATNCRSWKYPDKMAAELDVTELLDTHLYSDGDGAEAEEENQISHIILLELVIDRLVLFIHSMGRMAEQALSSSRASSAVADKASTSVGIVAKKHWTKVSQLCALLQQEQNGAKTSKKQLDELQETVDRLQAELSKYERSSVAVGLPTLATATGAVPADLKSLASRPSGVTAQQKQQQLLPPPTAVRGGSSNADAGAVSRDCGHRASQTIETAFVPCLSCGRVQDSLRQAGGAIAAACEAHGLASHLARFRRREADALDWLSPNDVARWSAEQCRDVELLCRLADERAAAAAAAEAERAAAEDGRAEAERVADECRKRAREDSVSAEARRLREAADADSILEAERSRAESLSLARADIERRLRETQVELSQQVERYRLLDEAKTSLEAELKAVDSEAAAARDRHAVELATADERTDTVQAQLTERLALCENAGRRNEALQAKQDALLRQIEELDNENENLRNDVATLEEAKNTLAEEVRAAEEDTRRLNMTVKEKEALIERAEREKQALEASMADLRDHAKQLEQQLVDAEERLRLLVDYPDLNGPVNPDFHGTGDIVMDMENQIKANKERINLLDKQNAGLWNSVAKLRERQSGSSSSFVQPQQQQQQLLQSKGPPLQLWKLTEPDMVQGDHGDHISLKEVQSVSKQFSMPRSLEANYGSAGSERLSTGDGSGKTSKKSMQAKAPTASGVASGSSSSVAVYSKLKQAGLLQVNQKADQKTTGGHVSSGEQFHGTTCAGCGRMYATAAELKLHKQYCTSGVI